jgi:beta-mannosidase
MQRPLSEFVNANGTDSADMFAVAELLVGGEAVSSNLLYFVPVKQVRLPAPEITTDLVTEGTSYRLRLSSKALARSVYVSFGDAGVQLSDNYFDVLPGKSVDITIHSKLGGEHLRRALKVVSLADAFAPAGEPPKAASRSAPGNLTAAVQRGDFHSLTDLPRQFVAKVRRAREAQP